MTDRALKFKWSECHRLTLRIEFPKFVIIYVLKMISGKFILYPVSCCQPRFPANLFELQFSSTRISKSKYLKNRYMYPPGRTNLI